MKSSNLGSKQWEPLKAFKQGDDIIRFTLVRTAAVLLWQLAGGL